MPLFNIVNYCTISNFNAVLGPSPNNYWGR